MECLFHSIAFGERLNGIIISFDRQTDRDANPGGVTPIVKHTLFSWIYFPSGCGTC